MSHMSVEPDTLNGPREWGRAIQGPPVPDRYGQPYGIPLSTARSLILDYDTRADMAFSGEWPIKAEADVVLFPGPIVDSQSTTRTYGWYWFAPQAPRWWPPQPGDVARIWNSTYLRQESVWRNAGDSGMTDADLLTVIRDDETANVTLLVRDGKPVQ